MPPRTVTTRYVSPTASLSGGLLVIQMPTAIPEQSCDPTVVSLLSDRYLPDGNDNRMPFNHGHLHFMEIAQDLLWTVSLSWHLHTPLDQSF